jgi:LPXTG-motif cell wall-anchored protein
MTNTTWWMIGGGTVVVLGIGGYLLYRHKKKSQNNVLGYSIQSAQSSIGNGVSVNTSGTASIKNEPNWNAPFDMNYLEDVKKWVSPKKVLILADSTASKLAKTLKNAKGTFNDDEYAVRDTFKKLRSKTDVASLSKAYYKDHNNKDLWQHLNSFLSHSEMKEYVWKYINRLPNYKLS